MLKKKNECTIKVYSKTILYWTCPRCKIQNEFEDRWDKSTPTDLECEHCGYTTGDWEMCE